MPEQQDPSKKKSWSDTFNAVWKIAFPYFVEAILKNFGGLKGWLIRKVLVYGGKQAALILNDWIKAEELAAAQKKEQEKYDKVESNPNATADDQGKAYEDLINAGKP